MVRLSTMVFVLGAMFCHLQYLDAQEIQANFIRPGFSEAVWSDPENWSTNPLYPDNGNGGFDYRVVADRGGGIELDVDAMINEAHLTINIRGANQLEILNELIADGMELSRDTTVRVHGYSRIQRSIGGTIVNSGELVYLSNERQTVHNLAGGVFEVGQHPDAVTGPRIDWAFNSGIMRTRGTTGLLANAITNSGLIEADAGLWNTGGYQQLAGVLHLKNGAELAGGNRSEITGGSIIGHGKFSAANTYLAEGAILSPGDESNKIGAITLSGYFRFRNPDITSIEGGSLVLDINGTETGEYDQLLMERTGGFSAIALPSFEDDVFIHFADGFDGLENDIIFPIVTNGRFLQHFRDVAEGQRVRKGGYEFNVSYRGNSDEGVILNNGEDLAFYNFSKVPEPTHASLLIIVGLFASCRTRRTGRFKPKP